MKKDAYYFPHFCNARGDRKIKRLRKDLGLEGYGAYFMLLEVLREQDNFKFPVDDIDLLADEFGISEAKLKTVVFNYTLFDVDDDNLFFSPKFDEYMQPYLNMKQQRIEAAKKSVEARRKRAEEKQKLLTTVERPLNGRINDRSTDAETTVKQSKVKKSKVNKRNIYKENNANARAYPFFDEFKEYANTSASEKLGITLDQTKLKAKYLSWSENNWINGNGKKIKNWKTTLLNSLPYLKNEDNNKADAQSRKNITPTEDIKWSY